MDKNVIYSLNNSASEFVIDRSEILRYMASAGDYVSEALIDELYPDAVLVISPSASFVRLDLNRDGFEFELGNEKFCSSSLGTHLKDCMEIVVLSLSLGHALDRIIARNSSLRPSAAFCLNAIGAAAVEGYADMICKKLSCELEKENMHLTPRFSPGYGDLPLSIQETLLSVSDAFRRVGISLNKSLVMSPSKSVTAIIGITKCDSIKSKSCAACGKLDCTYRKRANG